MCTNYRTIARTSFEFSAISTLFATLPSIHLSELTLRDRVIVDKSIGVAISSIVSLTYLEVQADLSHVTLDLSGLVLLSTLNIMDATQIGSAGLVDTLYTAPTASLTSLIVSSSPPNITVLSYFGLVRKIDFEFLGAYGNFSLDYLSNPTAITLRNLPPQVTTLSFAGLDQLSTIVLQGGNLQNITDWGTAVTSFAITDHPNFTTFGANLPPTIYSFSITNAPRFSAFPNAFFDLAMESGKLNSVSFQAMPLLTSLPSFQASSLDYFSLFSTGITDPNELCKLPPNSLLTLSIGGLPNDPLANGPFPLPVCLKAFTKLSTVQISNAINLPASTMTNVPAIVTALIARNCSPSPIASFTWSSFAQAFPSLYSLTLENASLNGTFPSELSAITTLGLLYLPSNALTGTISPNFFSSLPNLLNIGANNNLLSGPIPNLFGARIDTINLANNSFTSFSSPASSIPSISRLDISGNMMQTIPDDIGWTTMPNLLEFHLDRNPTLAGTPVPTFWVNSTLMQWITMSDCGFVGSLPALINATALLQLDLSKNALCGSLPSFPPLTTLNFASFSQNTFSGSIPSSYANYSLNRFDITANHLTGNASLSRVTSSIGNQHRLQSFYFSDNDFFGGLPNMRTMFNLKVVEAGNTLLELCHSNPSFLPSVQSCVALNMPNGGSCACKAWYSTCDTAAVSCTAATPYVPRAQISFDTCGTTLVPLPVFAQCDISTRPSSDFSCINGTWTSPGTATAPIVVSSPIVVYGNLSVPTITITSASASIVVQGCVSSGTVEIVLTPAQIEALQNDPKLSKLLITQLGANCSESLNEVHVTTHIVGKTCKKAKASTDTTQSSASSLYIVFNIDTSKCKVWWIVLASVLAGAALITIVASIVIFKVLPQMKRKRPAGVAAKSV